MRVVVEHAVEVLAVIDDQACADGLAALRAAGARAACGTPSSRQISNAARTSSSLAGTSTPTGMTW
jgi:hypothetical protein